MQYPQGQPPLQQQQPIYNQGYSVPQMQQQPMAQMPQQQPQQPGNPNYLQGAATQLMMDPNAWQSLGQHAFTSGQQYVDKNLNRWINWPVWKYYWNVSNSYVMKKISLILFPFRHSTWNRLSVRSEINGQLESYKPPRYDINAPDLYIPLMSFVSYIILVGLIMGTEERFTPEVLTLAASTATFFTLIEVVYLRLGMYLLSVNMQEYAISMADLLAYSAYQFVSIIFVQMFKIFVKHSLLNVAVYGYAFLSLGWFTLRSLRYIMFPSGNDAAPLSTSTPNVAGNPKSAGVRKSRVNFLFSFVVLQIFLCWLLVK